MKDEDIRFGRLSINLGFMQRPQVVECLQLRAQQAHKSLGDLCMERGYLDDEQVGIILGHLAREARAQKQLESGPKAGAQGPAPAATAPAAKAGAAAPAKAPGPAPAAVAKAPPVEDPFAEMPAKGGSPLTESADPFASLPPLDEQPASAVAKKPQAPAFELDSAPPASNSQAASDPFALGEEGSPFESEASPPPAARPGTLGDAPGSGTLADPAPTGTLADAPVRGTLGDALGGSIEGPSGRGTLGDAPGRGTLGDAPGRGTLGDAPGRGTLGDAPASRTLADESTASATIADGGPAGPTSESDMQPDPDLVTLLRSGRTQGAADVHLSAEREIAFRYLGQLRKGDEPMDGQRVERMLLSVMPKNRRAQLDAVGYSDFAVNIPGAGRFRANVSKHSTGLKGCFRTLADEVPTLEQLNLPPTLGVVGDFHQGLAIVAGPNGMGKTSTLAALVGILNTTRPCHIITIEDPVEIVHPIAAAVMTQREVGVTTTSFGRALKAALREDPDVIVIGELRDEETVEIALEAAETGHLVIATMSTRSGAKTIDRLIDMFPPDKQSPVRATLAGTLKIVVSQRLLPAAEGNRMVPAAEVIMGNTQLWNLIKDNKLIQLPSLMQRGKALGMVRFDESLLELVQGGVITEEVALGAAEAPTQLKRDIAAARAPRPAAAPDAAPATPERQSNPGGFNKFFGKK